MSTYCASCLLHFTNSIRFAEGLMTLFVGWGSSNTSKLRWVSLTGAAIQLSRGLSTLAKKGTTYYFRRSPKTLRIAGKHRDLTSISLSAVPPVTNQLDGFDLRPIGNRTGDLAAAMNIIGQFGSATWRIFIDYRLILTYLATCQKEEIQNDSVRIIVINILHRSTPCIQGSAF
jgi:hypothetical protein